MVSLQVLGNLAGMMDAWLSGIAERHFKQREAMVAMVKTPEDVARWQAYIRERVLASIGGFPQKTPLRARLTGTIERDGYRIEKLIYESLPGFLVTANVYVPASRRPPFAAVVGVAGHSNTGKAAAAYQSAWISMARRGFLVIAYDPPGQGERSEYWDAALGRSRIGIGTREHTMAGLQCMLTGTNIARYEIWDGIRAVDYLLTRPDVDPKRIAVAGNSGGGTQSAYLSVAEPRLAAAAPSCYITSWSKLWYAPGPQDAEQNFFGFLRDGLDFGDFLISMAPRPVSMMTAIRDFFPIDGARATFREAAAVFAAGGARDKIGLFEYDDGHGWTKPRREATYRFLEAAFHGRKDDPGIEGELSVEPAVTLQVTATGQVSTSGGTETVASLNRKLAEQIYPKRRAAAGGDAAALVRERLGVGAVGKVKAVGMGMLGRDGYLIERLALEIAPGITAPALLLVPQAGTRPLPGVLYLNSAGKAADAAPGGDMEALARAGHVVLALDARGWGETTPAGRSGGYGASYQSFMRAYLLGRSVAGMQVEDALHGLEYLRTRSEVDRNRLAVFGKGNGGVIALYTAALEPAVRKVAVERGLTSYMAAVRAPQHEDVFEVFVHGVLEDFDLPDIARAISPRPVWLVDPRTAAGVVAAADEYANSEGFRTALRPEGWSFENVYSDWLSR